MEEETKGDGGGCARLILQENGVRYQLGGAGIGGAEEVAVGGVALGFGGDGM